MIQEVLADGGESDMFTYTALGDSVTAGKSASSRRLAYPALTARHLEEKHQTCVVPFVLASTGWTSATLTSARLSLPSEPLRRSDAVSIWVGGNDIAQAGLSLARGGSPRVMETTLAAYGRNLDVLVRSIQEVSCARLVLCGQYNPFPHSPLAVQGVRSLNSLTAATAKQYGARYAPTDAWVAGREAELIYGYRTGRLEDVLTSPVLPIHPNDRGHALIARHLTPMLR